jgi:hypothetical protein
VVKRSLEEQLLELSAKVEAAKRQAAAEAAQKASTALVSREPVRPVTTWTL